MTVVCGTRLNVTGLQLYHLCCKMSHFSISPQTYIGGSQVTNLTPDDLQNWRKNSTQWGAPSTFGPMLYMQRP